MKKLSIIFRIVIGAVFILSAYSKLISPGLIEIILIDHGFTSTRESAAILVRLLVGLELALGVMLMFPFYLKEIVTPIAVIFLGVFTAYLIYTGFVLGDSQNCGCFGSMIQMSPIESIIKNFVMILMLAIIFKYSEYNKKNIYVLISVIIISLAATFFISPISSPANLKFIKYTHFLDEGRVDLNKGNKLIVIMNTECDHCQLLAKKIHELQKANFKLPNIYTLMFSEGSVSVDSFRVLTGFHEPYIEINSSDFFDLIGSSPPRIYWLENGVVKETWDDNFIEKIKSVFVE